MILESQQMDNDEDIMNHPEIRDILANLKGDVHIPFELIVADAEGRLSDDGHSKVALHLSMCSECSDILRQVRRCLDHKEDNDEEDGTPLSISVNGVLKQKIELATVVNSKRDRVAEGIAQILLPESLWFSIKPTIAVYRNWLKSSVEVEADESEQLPIAAFPTSSPQDTENFQIIVNAVRSSDYICDLLVERCDSLDVVGQKLPELVDDGTALFDDVTFSTEAKEDLLSNIKNILLSANF
jgi:hypothetical protein